MFRREVGWLIIMALATLSLVGFNGCEGGDGKQKTSEINLGDKVGMKAVEELSENAFTKFYQPVGVTVSPQVPGYELPVKISEATNYEKFQSAIAIEGEAAAVLGRNGFVVMDFGSWDKVAGCYEALKVREVPIFITSDSLLHLYHIQFVKTL